MSDEIQVGGYLALKDSGARRHFDTGAVRDVAIGKGRFDLLMPHAITRVAQTLEKGAVKYNDRNWEKGIPLSKFFDSGLRHLFQYLDGARDEDHLAQAAWNILALIETQNRIKQGRLPKSLDDLPKSLDDLPRPFEQEPEPVVQKCLSCVPTDDPTITTKTRVVIPLEIKKQHWQWCVLCGIKHTGVQEELTFGEFRNSLGHQYTQFEPFDTVPWAGDAACDGTTEAYREALLHE